MMAGLSEVSSGSARSTFSRRAVRFLGVMHLKKEILWFALGPNLFYVLWGQ